MGPNKQQTKAPLKEQVDEQDSKNDQQGPGRNTSNNSHKEKISAPGDLPGPPPVVTPELSYNKELTTEQLQDIYAESNVLEEAAKKLAAILGLEDNVFDARNLILLDYCLGNLMFARHANLNLKQSLMIYDLGHMILDLIRAKNPFADAERLFRNRLLSLSMIQYKPVVPGQNEPATNDQQIDTSRQEGKENIDKNAAPVEHDKSSRDEKKRGTGKPVSPGEGDASKLKESKKEKKQQKTITAAEDTEQMDEKLNDENENSNKTVDNTANEAPLFSSFDLQKIVPYFTSTVFQHYCLYQYCFTREHYNITRKERVLVETTAITPALIEAKSQEGVDAEEAGRIAAIEQARQDAHTATVRAEQELFDSLAAEARRLAEEELHRRALSLDEYIELSVRQKIEDARKNIIQEYEYREYLLIDKISQRQKEQSVKSNGNNGRDEGAVPKTSPASGKSPIVPPSKTKKKK